MDYLASTRHNTASVAVTDVKTDLQEQLLIFSTTQKQHGHDGHGLLTQAVQKR